MIDQVATREKSESVKQLENGVARLVNGHDYNPILEAGQSTEWKAVIKIHKRLVDESKCFNKVTSFCV